MIITHLPRSAPTFPERFPLGGMFFEMPEKTGTKNNEKPTRGTKYNRQSNAETDKYSEKTSRIDKKPLRHTHTHAAHKTNHHFECAINLTRKKNHTTCKETQNYLHAAD